MWNSLKELFHSSGGREKLAPPPPPPRPIQASLMDNLVYLRAQFSVSSDLTIREMEAGGCSVALVTLEGMVDRHTIADAVLLPMSQVPVTGDPVKLMEHVRDKVLGITDLLR